MVVDPVTEVYADPQKKSGENFNSRLKLVMKSGKFTLGYKSALKTLRSGKCTYPDVIYVETSRPDSMLSQSCYNFQQLSATAEVRTGILCHAFQN